MSNTIDHLSNNSINSGFETGKYNDTSVNNSKIGQRMSNYPNNKNDDGGIDNPMNSKTHNVRRLSPSRNRQTIVDRPDHTFINLQNVNHIDTNTLYGTIISGNSRLRDILNRLKPIKIPDTQGIDKGIMNDWDFNILLHFQTHSDPFCSVASVMIDDFLTYAKVDPTISSNFLRLVESLYNDTSYHNRMHGLMVAQKMACLAKFVNIFDKMSLLDRVSFIVAGLCHDIAHPGRTNAFYVNGTHRVAKMFNDKSVLENFHASCTFNILEIPEANIFHTLPKKDFLYCRSRIMGLILATDMADHFDILSKFRRLRLEYDKNHSEFMLATERLIIKAADISSSVVPWPESLEWVQRLLVEFYAQGDDEVGMGLPISPQCDRARHDRVYENQIYFLRCVVIPLYEQLEDLDEDGSVKTKCIRNVSENLSKWEAGAKVKLLDSFQYKCNTEVDLDLLT